MKAAFFGHDSRPEAKKAERFFVAAVQFPDT
jgi:hypothetical protein